MLTHAITNLLCFAHQHFLKLMNHFQDFEKVKKGVYKTHFEINGLKLQQDFGILQKNHHTLLYILQETYTYELTERIFFVLLTD